MLFRIWVILGAILLAGNTEAGEPEPINPEHKLIGTIGPTTTREYLDHWLGLPLTDWNIPSLHRTRLTYADGTVIILVRGCVCVVNLRCQHFGGPYQNNTIMRGNNVIAVDPQVTTDCSTLEGNPNKCYLLDHFQMVQPAPIEPGPRAQTLPVPPLEPCWGFLSALTGRPCTGGGCTGWGSIGGCYGCQRGAVGPYPVQYPATLQSVQRTPVQTPAQTPAQIPAPQQ